MPLVFLLLISLILFSENMAQDISIPQKVKFLALGDSYTIGESVEEHERWPVQLANTIKKKGVECDGPTIIATTGWRTDQLKNAILEANLPHDYNLVSLLIGVNNQYQDKPSESYRHEFEELLKMAIEHAGSDQSNVFVISIPDYGYTPFGKSRQTEVSKAIDEFNAINRSIAEKYGVLYVNITPISRKGLVDEKLVASDGLHPSGEMYAAWVALMLTRLKIQ